MELKFKEVDERYEDVKKLDISGYVEDEIANNLKIKTYLEASEINSIINQCLLTNNQLERELIKISKIVEYCTNIDIDLDKDGEISGEEVYNLIYKNRLYYTLYYNVDNYEDIDRLLNKQESLYNVFSDLSMDLNDKMDELLEQFNPSNTEAMIKELKEVVTEREELIK